MRKLLWRLVCETEGQDLIEYALLGALVAIGAIMGMQALAIGINNEFSTISASLSSAS